MFYLKETSYVFFAYYCSLSRFCPTAIYRSRDGIEFLRVVLIQNSLFIF